MTYFHCLLLQEVLSLAANSAAIKRPKLSSPAAQSSGSGSSSESGSDNEVGQATHTACPSHACTHTCTCKLHVNAFIQEVHNIYRGICLCPYLIQGFVLNTACVNTTYGVVFILPVLSWLQWTMDGSKSKKSKVNIAKRGRGIGRKMIVARKPSSESSSEDDEDSEEEEVRPAGSTLCKGYL